MEKAYVVLYVRQNDRYKELNLKVIERFNSLKIRHKTINLSDKFRLYGNEITYEGPFALEFSGSRSVETPQLPLVVAGDKILNGFEEIENNLSYLQKNYSE